MKIEFMLNNLKDEQLLYETKKAVVEDPFGGTALLQQKVEKIKQHCETVLNQAIQGIFERSSLSYIESADRLGKEIYVISTDKGNIEVSFTVDSYQERFTRMHVLIETKYNEMSNGELINRYDLLIEKLKLSIKKSIIDNWMQCIWLYDDQSEMLCDDLYPRFFKAENQIRAFCSKVLTGTIGYQWLKRFGLEKYKESIEELSKDFQHTVPEFKDVDASFFSMTLETLFKVLKEGIVYHEPIQLSPSDFGKINELAQQKKADNIFQFISKKRLCEKKIWDDVFAPYFDNPERFWDCVTRFIKNRNHIAHNKLLNWSAYRTILSDLDSITEIVRNAQQKYLESDLSEEMQQTIEMEADIADEEARAREEEQEYEESYWRERLREETGVDVLEDDGIFELFCETVDSFYNHLFDRYHFDVRFDVSVFSQAASSGKTKLFEIESKASEKKLLIFSDINIDDSADSDSQLVLYGFCDEKVICKATMVYHNGDGHENDDGSMMPDVSSEYNRTEYDEFVHTIEDFIEDELNPLLKEKEMLEYAAARGEAETPTADFPCAECGEESISIDASFYPIGKCCNCGYENEVYFCEKCGTAFGEPNEHTNICDACWERMIRE